MRVRASLLLAGLLCASSPGTVLAQAAEAPRTGAEWYEAACAACHGPDGKGAPRRTVGFDIPLPDFTDCSFATPEADADWVAVVHDGGRARAFDRMMPAFGRALSETDIANIVGHLRSFCAEPGWPRGDLNLPRPLVTEKAFPENEAVLTTAISRRTPGAVGNELLYERRVGGRGQYEIAVPFDFEETATGTWRQGIGDVAVAYKHVLGHSLERGTIVSGGSELVLPTSRFRDGFEETPAIVEPFATMSQILPRDGFLHLHAGLELPFGGEDAPVEAFWRGAVGRTFVERGFYRAWSPMLEVLGSGALEGDGRASWDVVPQLQVSLSTRQHVLVNAGLRIPVNKRDTRGTSLIVYLLWDWFDGGFFGGW
jgi:cytochrome c553